MMPITKELFVKTLNALKAQKEHDDKCAEAFQVILKDSYPGGYDNNWSENAIVDLLEALTGDAEAGWVQYFVYETRFGENFKDGDVCGADGQNISVRTPEELWDLLISSQEKA